MKQYTQEEVINLILQERNRCREICDGHSNWFQVRIDTFHPSVKRTFEEGKDACRKIRNGISQASSLDISYKPDKEKIKELYNL